MSSKAPGLSPTTALVSLLGVGSASVAYLYYYNRQLKNVATDPNEVVVPMLPFETSQMMMENAVSISSLTWYSGNVEDVQHSLRQKVTEILNANPWLTGKLATRYGGTSIVYTNDVTEKKIENIFTISNDFQITRKMPYKDLTVALEPLLVKVGKELLDSTKNDPIFRISIVPETDGNGFALITSLAHCVGDGQTYYTLHNMLSSDEEVSSLNVSRKMDLTQKIEDALGGPEQASSFSPNAGFIVRFLRGLISSKLSGPASVKLFHVPEGWIEEHKAKVQDGWVSTNDILTSHFFQTVDCDQATMPLNFRGKIQNCCPDDAGNYFQFLIFRPSDYETPSQIRLAINEIIESGSRKPLTTPMSSFEHLTSRKQFGTISNWCTFVKPVKLEGCQDLDLHIPLVKTDPMSVPWRFVSGMFVFRPDANNKVAALFAGHPDVLERLEETGMIGEEIA